MGYRVLNNLENEKAIENHEKWLAEGEKTSIEQNNKYN